MFGINNPAIVERHLARRRMLRRRVVTGGKEFWPLWLAISMRRKGRLYGRRLRQAQTPMWYFRPPWWFVGHPDWPEVTRAFERGLLTIKPHEARLEDFRNIRRQWHEYMRPK